MGSSIALLAMARYRVDQGHVEQGYSSLTKDLVRLLKVVSETPPPDAVHDVRVVARRLQAVLSIMPKDARADMRSFGTSLKGLLKITSGLRDTDIVMAELDAATTATVNSGGLASQREAEAARTRAAARAFIRGMIPQLRLGETDAKKLTRRLRKQLRERSDSIRLLLEEVLQSERKVKELHKLRIELKKLRYLLELAEGASKERAALSGWQDSLGKIHDCDITSEFLRGDPAAKGTIRDLIEGRHEAYAEFVRLSQKPRSRRVWKEIESRL